MAINLKKYVDITSSFPSPDSTNRAFGGLLITEATATVSTTATEDLIKKKDIIEGTDSTEPGCAIISVEEAKLLYGKDSDEYLFVSRYYDYISPTRRSPSALKIAKKKADETPLDALKRVIGITSGFGSFTFMPPKDTASSGDNAITMDTLLKVASYNAAKEDGFNKSYLMVVNDTARTTDEVTANSAKFREVEGVAFVAGTERCSGYQPMAILAATDYENGPVSAYCYKQFRSETARVTTDDTYDTMIASWVNFYGRTQSNGQQFSFYQRGFNTDGTETGIYCNEMWFKSACEYNLINLMMENEQIPASSAGVAMVKSAVISAASKGALIGAFMPKELSDESYRETETLVSQMGLDSQTMGEIEASLSTQGYAVVAYLSTRVMETKPEGTRTEPIIEYYVFYGTADSVLHIRGYNRLVK